jgi:hypothetical protein
LIPPAETFFFAFFAFFAFGAAFGAAFRLTFVFVALATPSVG